MTIFNTPILSSLLRLACIVFLKILGWKIKGELPVENRFVMIAHPHTSNFDLPLMLSVSFVFGLKLHWIGKDELFNGVFGGFMRWMGGLPIVRSGQQDEVERIAGYFAEREKMALAIVPAGTRSKTKGWRTGFYWIAVEADVPILLSFLDFGTKTTGVGPLIQPSGDLDADLAEIQAFYAGMTGKYPDQT